MNYKRWTCEEDARLLATHAAGKSPGAIAREHGRSLGAIQSRLQKHAFHGEQVKKCGPAAFKLRFYHLVPYKYMKARRCFY